MDTNHTIGSHELIGALGGQVAYMDLIGKWAGMAIAPHKMGAIGMVLLNDFLWSMTV